MTDGGKACLEQAHAVDHIVQSLLHPTRWTFVIICDDQRWQRALRNFDIVGETKFAFTDLKTQQTWLRGQKFTNPELGDDRVTPRYVVAHELAHIILQTRDEDRANRCADKLLKNEMCSPK